MTKTIFLKKSLESELKSNERFNGISTIEIPLKEEQSTHIYQSNGNYIADHLGQIVLTFSNETAWYWNKNLELTLASTGMKLCIGFSDGELENVSTLNDPAVGSFGTIALATDGNYTYTLDNANPLVQQLAGDRLRRAVSLCP